MGISPLQRRLIANIQPGICTRSVVLYTDGTYRKEYVSYKRISLHELLAEDAGLLFFFYILTSHERGEYSIIIHVPLFVRAEQ